MNPWQQMIDRCNAMDLRINEILTRRASIATARDNLVLYTIDDLETILFAVRWAANSLCESKYSNPRAGAEPAALRQDEA